MIRHPLTDDAIATLRKLRDQALACRATAEVSLRDPDLPRGPLPVMTRICQHETRAIHLRIAIEALGGEVEEAEFEARDREARENSGFGRRRAA